jgi:hypothetical protein
LSRHLFRPVVERLEERWLLAVTFNVDGNALSFSSDAGDELYLKIAAGGDLRYGTDGSNFTSTNFEVTAGSTVSYDQDNAVYLTGMDEGAGNFVMTGEVQVTGDLFTHGGDLTITGTSITVGPDVLISTSPPTGTSAAAGAITLTAARGSVTDGTFITLGANSRLQATGDAGDGVISLTADDTFEFVFNFTLVNQIYDLFNHKFQATIEVEPGAEIVGGDVSLKAESGVANKFTSTPNIGDSVGLGVLNFLTTILDNTVLSLPVSVLISKAYATTEIGENAAIHSSGSVNLSSSATANSTGEATNFLLRNMKVGVFSFAFAKAETSARSLLDENATITAAGDVSIASVTKTTTSATSLESRNPAPGSTADPNAIGLSAAVNELKTTSHAKVAQGAVIQSVQGNVTIAASATNKNTVKVQSNIYRNGIAGLSGAGANVNADVLASVDGTIIAGGRDTGSTVTLHPFAATGSTATPSGTTPVIDFANSRFVFAADPGYSTGEPLVYSSGLGGPIPGLSNNATYFAIASQSGSQFYLQLAATAAEAVATPPTFIAFGQYPTINGIPITNVDASADSAILFDFNPGFTEGQTVTIVPAAGQFLGYDNSDGSLGGPLSGTYTVHIVNDRVDSSQLYAIQLRTADGSTVQLDNRPYLTTAAGKTLRIQSVNTDGDLLVLDPADVPSGFDLANGDALVYHAGLATSITGLSDGATYYAIVDPSQFASVSVNSLLTLQFAATPQAAASANPVTTNPTLTWTDSHGVAQTTTIDSAVPGLSEALIGETYSLSIVSSDSATNVLTVALADESPPAAGATILSEGELFLYVGATGSSTTLQSGRLYQVSDVLDQSDPNAIQLTLQDAVRLPTFGTLTQAAGAGQSFTIQTADTASDNLLTITLDGGGIFTPLTEGETLNYAGASIDGYLLNGQSYKVHVVQQDLPSVIQVQLTPNYFVTPNGTLLDQAGNTFTITSSDPSTSLLTVSGPVTASLANGQTLTYQGPAIATAGYLQAGQQYKVADHTASGPGEFSLQLISAAFQVGTSGMLQGSGQAATNTSNNFNPLGQSFQITGGDADTGILTVALQAQSEFTSLVEGGVLRYQGSSGTGPNTLQNGQLYSVHVLDQTDSSAMRIQLQTTAQLAGYGTLTGPGGSYVIHKSDSDGTVWLSQIGSAEALVDGNTVTFQGTSGSGAGFLQDDQAYQVVVLNQDDPLNTQVRLARYVAPTYGTLAGAPAGPETTFSIQDFSPTTQVVTLAADSAVPVAALTDGQSLVYTGAALTGTSLLQDGRAYLVHVLDQSNPDSIQVLLLDPTGANVASSSSNGSDPAGNAVVLDSSHTPIPNGALVTYHQGGVGTKIGGLQDGVQYEAVVDADSPTIVRLLLTGANAGQPVALTLDETLAGNGRTYTITGSDGFRHALTISEAGAAAGSTGVAEGDALVYTGALGQLTGGLVDGQTYYVHLPNPSDTTIVQLLASPDATSPLAIQTSLRVGQLDQSFMSGTSHSLTPVNKAGISITATLGSTDKVTVSAGIGSEPIGKQVAELAKTGLLRAAFGGGSIDRPDAPVAGQFSGFLSASGSVLVQEIHNSAVAQVGSNAVLKSTRDITVSSAITENNQASNSATNSQSKPKDGSGESPRNFDLAISVSINELHNTATAEIAGGAQVDAAEDLAVTSDVIYPWAFQIANPEKFNTGLVFKGLFKGGLLRSELVNNWAMAASTAQNEAKLTLAGSVNYVAYDNHSTATIGAGALINQDAQYRTASQSVTVDAETNFQTVNYTGNTWFNFGLINAAAKRVNDGGWQGVGDTIFGGRNNAAAVGIGASLTYIELNNTTLATVGGPGTRLNFGESSSSLSQTFDGDADVDVDTYSINLASNPGFTTGMPVVYDNGGGDSIDGLTSGDTYYAIVSPANPRSIQLAKTAADAVANQPANLKGTGSGTQTLTAAAQSGFNVTATQSVLNVNLGTAGGVGTSGLGAGGKYGGNGTFAAFVADTNTTAQVASGTVVSSNPGTAGTVNVSASDWLTQVAVVGGAFKGQSIGVGLSGIFNDVTRTTQAIIGDQINSTDTGALPGSSTWLVAGPVSVTASATGDVINFALAAAVNAAPAASQQGGGEQADAAPVQQSSWGLQISGDGSYTKLADNTKAYINDVGTLTTGALSVAAADSTILAGFGGSFAIATLSDAKADTSQITNIGLAGSYAEIELNGATEASVRHARLTVAGDLMVTAERDNYLGTLTAASSSSGTYKDSWEIAGSVAISSFTGDTQAYLSGVSGSVSGDLTVTATDKTIYVAIGGGSGVGASLGVGVSFGYISIEHEIDAYAEATQLTVGGDVAFDVKAQTDVGALGVALGIAEGASWGAAAGNASVNKIAMTLDAHVSDNSSITAAGAVTIQATDHSYLVSVSGSVAVAKQGAAAVGAAVSYNLIDNSIQAYIDGSAVRASGGSLTVSAASTPTLIAVAVGGADADKIAIGGSVTINSITNSVAAYLKNATVFAGGDLNVTATESALLVAVAGAVALTRSGSGSGASTGNAAVGAAVAYNYVGQSFDPSNPAFPNGSPAPKSSVEAYIAGSQVTVEGDLLVSAGMQPPDPLPDVSQITIDGSTGFGFTLDLNDAIEVDTQLVAVAVGGAGAASFTLGGAVTMAYVRQTIQAYIADSPGVNVTGDVTITAIDDSSIGTGSGGVAIAGSKAAAVGAGVAYNDLENNLLASINGSTVTANGSLSVVSQETSDVTAVAVGGSEADKFALGGALVISVINNDAEAHIRNNSIVQATSVLVSSTDDSTIQAGAGQVSIATNGVSVGAAVTVSNLTNTTSATIENSTATATASRLQILADSNLNITAAAAGLDVANDFTLGGSVVYNTITSTTEAVIDGSTTNSAGLAVSAIDNSHINTGAGNASIGIGDYSAMGAGVAVNRIDNTVVAHITASSVSSSGQIDVTAETDETILAVALGISGSVTNKVFSLSLVGSGAGNHVKTSTQALIDGGSTVTTTAAASGSSPLNVTASDSSSITAGAGALSFDVSLFDGSASAAVGVSAALNEIGTADHPATVSATISGSTVNVAGDVTLTANGSPTITSYTVAGAGEFSDGASGANIGIAGAGAGSSNTINGTVQTLIEDSASVTTTHGGDVNLLATNGANIVAGAGGIALAGAVGSSTGVAVSVGAALAINEITITTAANILGATVQSAGAVELLANDNSKITAAAVGVAGSLASGSEVGVAIGGAGSGVGNAITNTTQAQIADGNQDGSGTRSSVTSGGDVTLTATNNATIIGAAGTLAFSIGLSFDNGGEGGVAVAPAIGVSVAINSITNTVAANIMATMVDSGGDVTLTAQSLPPTGDRSIQAVTIAGGAAVGVAKTVSVAFAGAGAGSGNAIHNTVTASITSDSAVTATGDIRLSALDGSSILADGGGATVSVSVGMGEAAVAPAIGAGEAKNTLTNTTKAWIDASQATASGQVAVDASSNPDIRATAFGVAVSVAASAAAETGIAGAGSGAAAYNTITNTTESSIQNGSTVSASATGDDAVVVSAADAPSYTATSGSGSLGFSVGQASVALAVGVSLASNTVTSSTVSARIDGASGIADTATR